jgi:hypothetical protein
VQAKRHESRVFSQVSQVNPVIPYFFNRKLNIIHGLKHPINFSHLLYKGDEN